MGVDFSLSKGRLRIQIDLIIVLETLDDMVKVVRDVRHKLQGDSDCIEVIDLGSLDFPSLVSGLGMVAVNEAHFSGDGIVGNGNIQCGLDEA